MKQGSYPISELLLHLAASMACMSLKDIDAAKTHFGAAWNIARPDGSSSSSASTTAFYKLIEACLKSQYPDDFARIIEITCRFSYGWRRINNPDSGEDVADDLTTTEFTMAMLACVDGPTSKSHAIWEYRRAPLKTAYPAYMQSLASELAPSWLPTCCASGQTDRHIESAPEPRRFTRSNWTFWSSDDTTATGRLLAKLDYFHRYLRDGSQRCLIAVRYLLPERPRWQALCCRACREMKMPS